MNRMTSVRFPSVFGSFFLGGFECSAHRRRDGQRLDLLAATGHDRLAAQDYRQLARYGIHAVRDGLRWHLIERAPRSYDWSSITPMLAAAREAGVQVVWDLCHYGWPDDLDIWSAAFLDRFAGYAAAVAQLMRLETDRAPFYCPINELSYWAWAGGETGRFNPSTNGRGAELKRQLVRSTIAAVEAIRAVDPRARFITAEPLINVGSATGDGDHTHAARVYHLAQYEALDMLTGRMEPALGGRPDYLDVVGVNYYPENQWYHHGPPIPLGHHAYRPLHELLGEVHARYGRPLLIAETGAEGSARPSWLHYVCAEVEIALQRGVPIEGICLYPIIDYPGWDDGRTCQVGLLSNPDEHGARTACGPFARELRRQRAIFRGRGLTPERSGALCAAE
jgi:beta-glucosidase/6-phospho-beta-glucosidase/beta-galactosidase